MGYDDEGICCLIFLLLVVVRISTCDKLAHIRVQCLFRPFKCFFHLFILLIKIFSIVFIEKKVNSLLPY